MMCLTRHSFTPSIFREALAALPISVHTTCEPELCFSHCYISKNNSSFSTRAAFSAGGAPCPRPWQELAVRMGHNRAGGGHPWQQRFANTPSLCQTALRTPASLSASFPRIPPPPAVPDHPTHRPGSLQERGQAPSPPRQPRTPRAPRTHPDGAGDAVVLREQAAVVAVAALAQPHRAGTPAQAARQRRAALREGGQEAAALGLQLGQVAGQPRAPQLLRQLLRQLQRRGLARPRGGGETEEGEGQRRQQRPAQAPRRRHGDPAEEPEAPRRERAGPRRGAPPLIGWEGAGAEKGAGPIRVVPGSGSSSRGSIGPSQGFHPGGRSRDTALVCSQGWEYLRAMPVPAGCTCLGRILLQGERGFCAVPFIQVILSSSEKGVWEYLSCGKWL